MTFRKVPALQICHCADATSRLIRYSWPTTAKQYFWAHLRQWMRDVLTLDVYRK